MIRDDTGLQFHGMSAPGSRACGDDDDDIPRPSIAPASHTASQDGVPHLPGLNDPESNSSGCNGADPGGAG